jgi:hypothetical protein
MRGALMVYLKRVCGAHRISICGHSNGLIHNHRALRRRMTDSVVVKERVALMAVIIDMA